MSYYITAHRHGAKINMPVEEKHKYITDTTIATDDGADICGYSLLLNSTILYGNNLINVSKQDFRNVIQSTTSSSPPTTGTSKSASGIINGLNLPAPSIRLFYRPQQLSIKQGTGSRERIGDKVFLKTVQIMINLSASQKWFTELNPLKNKRNTTITTFRPTAYTTSSGTAGTISTTTHDATLYNEINWRQNHKQWAKFRVMIVRFNDLTDQESSSESSLKEYIQNWFNTIFVPSMIIPNDTFADEQPVYKDIMVVSNQSKMLRESTNYNGKYKIIYDQMIELNNMDTNKFITIKLDPKMNLTFKDDNTPTAEKYNDVYGFIIPPTFYKMDMDTCTYQAIETMESSAVPIASFSTNIKFTYYDI